jgi:hypothetical protein
MLCTYVCYVGIDLKVLLEIVDEDGHGALNIIPLESCLFWVFG